MVFYMQKSIIQNGSDISLYQHMLKSSVMLMNGERNLDEINIRKPLGHLP